MTIPNITTWNLFGGRSPFARGARGPNGRSYGELSLPDSDISFVNSGRSSVDRLFPSFYDNNIEISKSNPRLSASSDLDGGFEPSQVGRKSVEIGSPPEFLSIAQENDRMSWSSQSVVRTWNVLARQIIPEAYSLHP